MALTCTVCGCAYLPWDRVREDCCKDCFDRNFAASQELRVDTPPPLAERQRQAALRLAVAHAREAEHQRYQVECAAALRQLMAGEDSP